MRRLLLTLVAFVVLCAPAQASRTMDIGLQDDYVLLGESGFPREIAFARAAELGVTKIRANVLWSRVLKGTQAERRTRPARRTYELEHVDMLVALALEHGMKVELTLAGPAPRWATADRRKVSNTSPSAKEFARFAADVAKRYRGKVERYSIWNEPNWHTWLNPARTAAQQYRALYLAAYSAIKRADPKAKVVLGELAPQARAGSSFSPLRFLREVLCVDERWKKRKGCGRVRADAVSLHPYDYRRSPKSKSVPAGDVTIGTVSRLTNALTRLRRAGALSTAKGREPAVHLTEFAYFAAGPLAFSRSKRAQYITQAFELARKNPKVAELLYFGLLQRPDRQWNTGLLRPDGAPDTAFTSLKQWVERQKRRGLLNPGG
jgi:GH35 family endo-1,4-beta-xylanase